MSTPDETPTERRPATWVGSAPVNRPRQDPAPVERTLDLPVHERVPQPPPQPPTSRRQPPPPPPPKPWPPVREGWEPPSLRRKRRRKWPWVLLVMLVFCGGCCGLTYRWGKQFYDQYPSAADVTATVTGLAVVDNDASAAKSAEAMRKAFDSDQLDEARFTVVYADTGNDRARVIAFGTTRFITDPKKALTDGLQKLTPIVELSGVRDVSAGSLGGQERCGSGRLSGKTVSVCAWADHGSLGGAVFASRGIETSGPLLQQIRASVIKRQSY